MTDVQSRIFHSIHSEQEKPIWEELNSKDYRDFGRIPTNCSCIYLEKGNTTYLFSWKLAPQKASIEYTWNSTCSYEYRKLTEPLLSALSTMVRSVGVKYEQQFCPKFKAKLVLSLKFHWERIFCLILSCFTQSCLVLTKSDHIPVIVCSWRSAIAL